jgi:hypothetical protein
MKRREFVAGLGSAVAWPIAAGAQQDGPVRRIGLFSGFDERDPVARALAAERSKAGIDDQHLS